MEADLKLFHDFENGTIPSTLRIYSWQPNCVSLGYAQKADQLIDAEKVKTLGWDIVKRPTGGGIVFHNEAEVTYSLVTAIDDPLLPKGLVPSYKKISEAVVAGLKLLGVDAQIAGTSDPQLVTRDHLCFSFPAEYEIVVAGKKIVGSAQKRGKRTLLQQGSIFVRRSPKEIFSALKVPCEIDHDISVEELLGRKVGFDELSEALIKGFQATLGIPVK